MLNKVQIIGRSGQDVELRYTPNGNACCYLSIATSEKYTGKDGQRHEKTEWHKVVLWQKLAEIASQYIHKGRQVYIEGKLQTRKYTDKNGIERYSTDIIGQTIKLLGDPISSGKAQGQARPQQQNQQNWGPGVEQTEFTADDIPF